MSNTTTLEARNTRFNGNWPRNLSLDRESHIREIGRRRPVVSLRISEMLKYISIFYAKSE